MFLMFSRDVKRDVRLSFFMLFAPPKSIRMQRPPSLRMIPLLRLHSLHRRRRLNYNKETIKDLLPTNIRSPNI